MQRLDVYMYRGSFYYCTYHQDRFLPAPSTSAADHRTDSHNRFRRLQYVRRTGEEAANLHSELLMRRSTPEPLTVDNTLLFSHFPVSPFPRLCFRSRFELSHLLEPPDPASFPRIASLPLAWLLSMNFPA